MDRATWTGLLAFLLSAGVVGIGGLLVAKHANSNNGTVLGWILIAGGLFCALAAVAYLEGAFGESSGS